MADLLPYLHTEIGKRWEQADPVLKMLLTSVMDDCEQAIGRVNDEFDAECIAWDTERQDLQARIAKFESSEVAENLRRAHEMIATLEAKVLSQVHDPATEGERARSQMASVPPASSCKSPNCECEHWQEGCKSSEPEVRNGESLTVPEPSSESPANLRAGANPVSEPAADTLRGIGKSPLQAPDEADERESTFLAELGSAVEIQTERKGA